MYNTVKYNIPCDDHISILRGIEKKLYFYFFSIAFCGCFNGFRFNISVF